MAVVKLGPSGSETTLPIMEWMKGNKPDLTVETEKQIRLETMTDGTGTYQYGYDELNRLTTTNGPWVNDTITYTYDKLGNLKSLIPQIGQTITYNYDYDTGYTDLDKRHKRIFRQVQVHIPTITGKIT
ncbi:hypothetical protein LCGC14_2488220, partial [marine sediment metagenome]